MSLSAEDTQAVLGAAAQLQVDPNTLGGLIELESGFDPNIWGGAKDKNGRPQHRGLLQFGPGARQEVGLPSGPMTVAEQMPYAVKYFLQRGFQPGKHGPTELYRTVLVGNPFQSGTDSFGTNSDAAARRMQPGGDLYQRAAAKLGNASAPLSAPMGSPPSSPSATAPDPIGAMIASMFRGGGAVGDVDLDGQTPPRPRMSNTLDPVKAYAEASLLQAEQSARRRRMAGGGDFIKALSALAPLGLPGTGRSRRTSDDLLLPDEREAVNGYQGDPGLPAIEAVFGDGQQQSAGVSASALAPVGGKRPGVRTDWGDRARIALPNGKIVELLHGDVVDLGNGEFGYKQGGHGPSGPATYGPHFDVKLGNEEFFERTALDPYLMVDGKPLSAGVTVQGGEYGASRDYGRHRKRDYAYQGAPVLRPANGARWLLD